MKYDDLMPHINRVLDAITGLIEEVARQEEADRLTHEEEITEEEPT